MTLLDIFHFISGRGDSVYDIFSVGLISILSVVKILYIINLLKILGEYSRIWCCIYYKNIFSHSLSWMKYQSSPFLIFKESCHHSGFFFFPVRSISIKCVIHFFSWEKFFHYFLQ